MDLNLMLWLGGMCFSLAIFVLKVSCGLGWGQVRRPLAMLVMLLYLAVFILAAVFSGSLMRFLEPLLRQGPWLHAFMAGGMMAWGFYLLFRSPAVHRHGSPCRTVVPPAGEPCLGPAKAALLLLILPCPVCLTAIIFSTWAALQIFRWPSWTVGLGLGLSFVVLTLAAGVVLRLLNRRATLLSRTYGLALSLVGIGAYFLASLFLPAQIDAAKGIYQSFATENGGPSVSDQAGVFAVLVIALLLGFVLRRKPEVLP
jgi:predicted transporter|uniref:Uncharacterized protein n=1 Tax=Desulfobacca acetoxidans TaxID=60893 RepID=A0A7C5AMY4_9BACT